MNGFDGFDQLTEVLSSIYSAQAGDFPQVLDELTRAAAVNVPGAQEAGITVSNRQNEVSTPSVTAASAKVLDEIQQRHLEGPCLEAAWTRTVVTVDDLVADTRWPKYRADALNETAFRSVLSLPMFVDELSMGALNFYTQHAHAFDEVSRSVAATFATLGALAWSNVVRGQQFHMALDSRDTIGQAKGILIERYQLDSESSFNMLVKLSQSTNTPLREIAVRLIDDAKRR